jgi:hypothetical protein
MRWLSSDVTVDGDVTQALCNREVFWDRRANQKQ